jgi:hypothetical protein
VQSSPDLAQPAIEMYSPQSGIKVSVVSDQPAIQVYTCSGISGAKGSLPRKRSQGGDGTLAQIYENHSCIVLEMEEWIDGINHPEWNRTQIYAPEGQPYIWNADYTCESDDATQPAAPADLSVRSLAGRRVRQRRLEQRDLDAVELCFRCGLCHLERRRGSLDVVHMSSAENLLLPPSPRGSSAALFPAQCVMMY